jgi:hypothetical protein
VIPATIARAGPPKLYGICNYKMTLILRFRRCGHPLGSGTEEYYYRFKPESNLLPMTKSDVLESLIDVRHKALRLLVRARFEYPSPTAKN